MHLARAAAIAWIVAKARATRQLSIIPRPNDQKIPGKKEKGTKCSIAALRTKPAAMKSTAVARDNLGQGFSVSSWLKTSEQTAYSLEQSELKMHSNVF